MRVGSRSVHCASGGGHRPSPCLLFSIINRSQGAPLKRRFCVGGVQKMLGSWLGSTWIHFVTCHEKCIFCKEFAWILAWIHLDPVSHIYKNCRLSNQMARGVQWQPMCSTSLPISIVCRMGVCVCVCVCCILYKTLRLSIGVK